MYCTFECIVQLRSGRLFQLMPTLTPIVDKSVMMPSTFSPGDIEMIRIIANISVEVLQRRGSMTPPTGTTPTGPPPTPPILLSSEGGTLAPIEETDEPTLKTPSVEEKKQLTNGLAEGKEEPPQLLDPALLIKHLQNAYRLPGTPTLSLLVSPQRFTCNYFTCTTCTMYKESQTSLML